jgi:hypothetical protein
MPTSNHPTTPSVHRENTAQNIDVTQDPEEQEPSRPSTPPQPGPNAPPPPKTTRIRREAAHYAGLVLASMAGCLIRLGLEALGSCASPSHPQRTSRIYADAYGGTGATGALMAM